MTQTLANKGLYECSNPSPAAKRKTLEIARKSSSLKGFFLYPAVWI